MIYKVQAHFSDETLPTFFEKLTDGTIANQRPDGQEIVASMQRAVLLDDNTIQWSEMCFCSPPLQHERSTVYDHYLHDFTTEAIGEYEDYAGDSFWDYMQRTAGHDENNA